MFASTIPGSTDIVVKVAAMERAYRSETPDWQFGDRGREQLSSSSRRNTASFTKCSGSVPALVAICDKLRFLLGREMYFHAFKIRENRG